MASVTATPVNIFVNIRKVSVYRKLVHNLWLIWCSFPCWNILCVNFCIVEFECTFFKMDMTSTYWEENSNIQRVKYERWVVFDKINLLIASEGSHMWVSNSLLTSDKINLRDVNGIGIYSIYHQSRKWLAINNFIWIAEFWKQNIFSIEPAQSRYIMFLIMFFPWM